MSLVIDSSVAISWMLADEDSQVARRALAVAVQDGMIVPRVFWYEFRNTLIVNERRGRLQPAELEQALSIIQSIDPQIVEDHAETELLRLCRMHHLSVYDAAYVELALRNEIGLATLDRQMGMAAAKEGVPVLQ